MGNAASMFERSRLVIPGGVNSPVRAFESVGGNPIFASSAVGSYIYTTDGRQLIDFISSWGALILGHSHEVLVDAIQKAVRSGTSFGVPTESEVELAELVVDLVPGIDMVRMVNSGTEATASAVRLARATTGRNGIVKFEGSYHGHADPFLVKAGSGAATLGIPDSPGVPGSTARDTYVATYNDLGSVEELLATGEIAAVIVEPVAGNMGVVPPEPDFLPGLRDLCTKHSSLLIFDEVMTGFRVSLGGAQELYGVMPDLTCLGKVVAGGTPAAAYGGRADLMEQIAPSGPVYQAGTLAGNPIVTAAGIACLTYLRDHPDIYSRLEVIGARLESVLTDTLQSAGVDGCVQRVGSMMTVFFGPEKVQSWSDASSVNRAMFSAYFQSALRRGVLLPPSPFESMFLMMEHESSVDDAIEILALAIVDAR